MRRSSKIFRNFSEIPEKSLKPVYIPRNPRKNLIRNPKKQFVENSAPCKPKIPMYPPFGLFLVHSLQYTVSTMMFDTLRFVHNSHVIVSCLSCVLNLSFLPNLTWKIINQFKPVFYLNTRYKIQSKTGANVKTQNTANNGVSYVNFMPIIT